MSTEKLTQRALEQHDKIHPKLQHTKSRSPSHHERPRLFSRTESALSLGGPSQAIKSQGRKGSRISIVAPPQKKSMDVFQVVAAARAWRRLSQRKLYFPERPKVKLENTYRLGPKPEEKFHSDKVQSVISGVLETYLREFQYSQEASKRMCLKLSTEIKTRVKMMNFPRYKIICSVIIMQNKGQGAEVSSRCVWNSATDSYASFTYRNDYIVAVANVHGVYFE